jgi:hypothetical protein
LGSALYGVGCVIAGLLVVGGIWFVMLAAPSSQNLEYLVFLVLFLVAALLARGVGRGLKYVLTGR